MMIKQFIYMYLQRRISASDSKHVMSSVTIRTPAVSKRTLSGPIKHGEPLFTATESKLSPCASDSERSGYILAWARVVPSH